MYTSNSFACSFQGRFFRKMYSPEESDKLLKALSEDYKNLELSPVSESKPILEKYIKNQIDSDEFANLYRKVFNKAVVFIHNLAEKDKEMNRTLFAKEYELSNSIIKLIKNFEHQGEGFDELLKNCIIKKL